jgi:Ca2+-binding RTX toxin-like protein
MSSNTSSTTSSSGSSYKGDGKNKGGKGNDTIYGSKGNDNLSGGKGNDKLYGGKGNDNLSGGKGNDIIYGGKGNDNANGGKGNDTIYGGKGNDNLYGGKGNDTIYGNNGNDNLYGNNGNDILYGGSGHDNLYGGNGNDILVGGGGYDTLTGGNGYDTFRFASNGVKFASSNLGVDTITDFNSSQDKIGLSKSTFSALHSSTGNGFSSAGEFAVVNSDAAAAESKALIVYNSSNGYLFYNENGGSHGLGNGGHFATISNHSSLGSNNFTITT